MVLEITDVHDKKTAEEYMILRAIELGGTLTVPEGNFDKDRYRREKIFYEDSRTILIRDYGIDPRASDKVIRELESLAHKYWGRLPGDKD